MGKKKSGVSLSKDRLHEMIEEATVDAYDEEEQLMGFFNILQDELELPFETKVLGVEVTVESLDFRGERDIVGICRHGKEKQTIPIVDIPLPSPPPKGWEWIEAYREWSNYFSGME